MHTLTHTTTTARWPAGPPLAGGLWAIAPGHLPALHARRVLADAWPATMPPPPANPNGKPYDVTAEGVAIIGLVGVMLKTPTPWDGLLGSCIATGEVATLLRMAATDPDVSAIVLVVESPGGQVAGTHELAATVAAVGQRKPVVAYVDDLCCSAALWVASQAGRIIANPPALVGSIGTYVTLVDTTAAQTAAGLRFVTVASGPLKGAGADGSVTPEVQADTQRLIDGLAGLFTAAVAAGRGMTPAQVANLATGQVWVGQEAADRGLVDQVGGLADAVAAAADLAGTTARASVPLVSNGPTPARTALPAAALPTPVAFQATATTAATVGALTPAITEPPLTTTTRLDRRAAARGLCQQTYTPSSMSLAAPLPPDRSDTMTTTMTTPTTTPTASATAAVPNLMTDDQAKAAARAAWATLPPERRAAFADDVNLYVGGTYREHQAAAAAKVRAAMPAPLTPDVAAGVAALEWDHMAPAARAGYADDPTLYVTARKRELLSGQGPRPTVNLAAAADRAAADARAAEAKAPRFIAVDPVALGEWRKDWSHDRAGCRQRFASEEDYLAARHDRESTRSNGDMRNPHRRTY